MRNSVALFEICYQNSEKIVDLIARWGIDFRVLIAC